MAFRFLWLACALAAALPLGARAQDMQFSVSVSGITAGTYALSAQEDAARYRLSAVARSAGLAGLFSSFEVRSTVSGGIVAGRLVPETYASRSSGARAGRSAELEFRAGTPRVISRSAERDADAPPLDPASLTGMVDPLTALYMVLRDTPRQSACQIDLNLYDGHRHSALTVSGLTVTEDGVLCQGSYRRVAGYPPRDMAERSRFDFTVLYSEGSGILRVQRLEMNSLLGPARMTRD